MIVHNFLQLKDKKFKVLMRLNVLLFLCKSAKFGEGNIHYQYGSMNPHENPQTKIKEHKLGRCSMGKNE
jgi:hypothetical protein